MAKWQQTNSTRNTKQTQNTQHKTEQTPERKLDKKNLTFQKMEQTIKWQLCQNTVQRKDVSGHLNTCTKVNWLIQRGSATQQKDIKYHSRRHV